MTRIIEHLSVEDLEQRYRTAQDATAARHTQAISPKRAAFAAGLPAQGRSVLDVAGVLAFAPRWVEKLAARCNERGPDVLGDQRRHNGRAGSVLTAAVLAALAERLRTPPEDGGRWTGAKVAIWMAAQLGLAKVHPQRGWKALKRVRWPIQAPRPRHPRSATPKQQAEFKGGSTRRSHAPGPHTPTSRSRSAKSRAICAGPRTGTASA